jgi:hypothetical protein
VLFEIVGRPAPALPAPGSADAKDLGLLACPHCGHHTLLDEPVQQTHRVCLGCGLVPILSAS